jgi:predicted dehydrogenase
MTPLCVLIVGCGNIAGLFDVARGPEDLPVTHAGAYMRDGRFRVMACVEPDDTRRNAFAKAWRIPKAFRTLEEAMGCGERFDVISICSPTGCHARDVRLALELKPKLIFCEKPVTDSLEQTESVVDACEESGVPLAVNYVRRWDPAIKDLKNGIDEGRWGILRSAVGYYNKGLLNNGSHMIDLWHFLLGPLVFVNAGKGTSDFFPEDPTVPALLETAGRLPVQLACGHAKDFALFEAQFLFSGAMLTMEEGGMYWSERRVAQSKTFAGYRVLDAGVRRPGAYAGAMLRSVDNIFGAITRGDALASTGESALVVQRLCEEITRHGK